MHEVTRLPIYQVDAFASRVFAGNPAAIVPLASWLPDATLQAIAGHAVLYLERTIRVPLDEERSEPRPESRHQGIA